MRRWSRALIVPLIAVGLWFLPSDRPETEVAGAVESAAALFDDASATDSPEGASEPAAPTTTTSTTTSTQAPEPEVRSQEDADLVTTTTTTSPATTTATTTPVTTAAATTQPPTSTQAPTTVAPATTEAQLTLGEQALARVSFDWKAAFPDWQVTFSGPRNGIRALTYPDQKRVEIYVRSSDTASTLHRVFAHELGHIIDVERNSDLDRQRWLRQREIRPSALWWPSAEAPDFATGAGDFAEAFAVWETGVTTRSTVSGQPSAADIELLIELSQG